MPIISLPDRGVIAIAGEEAHAFLNGLVTADVTKITPEHPLFAAILSPQGKIQADFFIIQAEAEDGGGLYLDCPRALAPEIVQRLTMYRLRAKVGIADLSETLGVAVAFGDASFDSEDWLSFVDPRLAALGHRLIGPREALAGFDGAPAAYVAHRVALGVPEGGKDFAYIDTFPHEALMDQLHGVDFQKGCYVGQEIVSRMEHRGTARTRIMLATYEGGFAPAEGVPVFAGDKAIGVAGSQASGQGLVLVRLDRLNDAFSAGVPVKAGGIGLTARKPDYARFAWPPVAG